MLICSFSLAIHDDYLMLAQDDWSLIWSRSSIRRWTVKNFPSHFRSLDRSHSHGRNMDGAELDLNNVLQSASVSSKTISVSEDYETGSLEKFFFTSRLDERISSICFSSQIWNLPPNSVGFCSNKIKNWEIISTLFKSKLKKFNQKWR